MRFLTSFLPVSVLVRAVSRAPPSHILYLPGWSGRKVKDRKSYTIASPARSGIWGNGGRESHKTG
jgi:hypothetical protein